VAGFLAEVADIRAGGFEDPQAQQPEHGHQREVVPVGGMSERCDTCLVASMRSWRCAGAVLAEADILLQRAANDLERRDLLRLRALAIAGQAEPEAVLRFVGD